MATLLPPEGEARDVTPDNGQTFTLKELQAVVGGDIQVLRTRDGRWLIINEDGKRLQMPLNIAATYIMAGLIADNDYVVGNAVLCSSLEAGAEQEGPP